MSPDKAKPVIAIDGTAGSGKSTVARAAADALGFTYVDTGAMYRVLTLKAVRSHTDFCGGKALAALAARTTIELRERTGEEGEHVFLDGQDATADIRMPDVTANVSEVSSHPEVRTGLVTHQRRIVGASAHGAVVEGRDVGTVVFPDATLKIYLDASVEVRARRRQKDMAAAGVEVSVEELIKLLNERDKMDSTRTTSPLKKAPDAVVVDTTDLSKAESIEAVVKLAKERLKCFSG
ncbi:MAG: (d)CMP kinase [Actinomycetota bacterium]